VQDLLANEYSPERMGLPGNGDSGIMSSWYVCSVIALYPNSGQPYYIASALFTNARIDLGDEKPSR
jgi:putative alpha-1,2-mannosidase